VIWPRGDDGLVLPQGAGAVAGAVDHHPFLQPAEIGGGVEGAGLDPAALQQEVAGQQVGQFGDVELHRGSVPGAGDGEGVLRRLQVVPMRGEIAQGHAEEADVGDGGRALGEGDPRVRAVEQGVAVGPGHRLAGQSQQGLEGGVGGAGHLLVEGGEGGIHLGGVGDAAVWAPGAGGAGRAGVGRAVLGVDGHLGAGAQQGERGGQADGPAADDGHLFDPAFQGLAGGDLGAAPGEGPAAAAVAVVVHHPLAGDALDVEAGAGGAERPDTDGDLGDPVDIHAQRRQRRDDEAGLGKDAGREAGGAEAKQQGATVRGEAHERRLARYRS